MTRIIKKRRKLGEILVHSGKIEPEKLTSLLRVQKETGKPLGQLLIDEGILTKEELSKALGEQMGIPHVWLRKGLVDPKIVQILPKEKALHYQVLPMFLVNGVITLATSDPYGFYIFDEVRKITNLEVQPVICRAEDILEAIPQAYQGDASIDELMSSADESSIDVVEGRSEAEIAELAEMAEDSPIVNLTNLILLRAIRDGASDIHIEPQEDRLRIRVRVDGMLYEQRPQKIELHPAVVSRLKVMAKLNIAERRLPQDGRIQVVADSKVVDLRFSSMPGVYGEKVVMRILDRSQAILDLNSLGFEEELLENFKSLVRASHGLILVCGPTGSGKTTTLYSGISLLNTPERNIITVEDPVEYQIPNINQNQVNAAIGLQFATFIRHALRQDPDVIMVGEIRDKETAEIAIQASLTGHLVLSTLHTNDSPSSITRLLEMGIEPYLLSSSLLASLSQRLVRTICSECKAAYYPTDVELTALGIDSKKPKKLFRGEGCRACYDSGFKGRTGIHELLTMDTDLQALILENPTIDEIRKHCNSNGYRGLKGAGYQKVLDHQTTIEEVHRVSSLDI
jgi:type IV pilus assembly protein PilB